MEPTMKTKAISECIEEEILREELLRATQDAAFCTKLFERYKI